MPANNFEEKSDKTFESAELLVLNGHKNSSIHCYYYSCLQLLNHFLVEKCRFTEKEIRNKVNDRDSHNLMFALVKEKLDEEGKNYVQMFSALSRIKKQRIEADYGMAFVTSTEDTRKQTVNFRDNFKSLLDEL